MSVEVLTVTQAIARVREVIEEGTGPFWVDGELSGFKRHLPSGHLYFDLKDGRSRISCVMWREQARRLRFEPADGMQLRAHGRFGVYEVQGRLQLYADALEPAGLGELQAALERLKAKLAAEGLFDSKRKRPLPSYPRRIGVATSSSGAAVRDILRVLGQRWPIAEVFHRPCAVQGEGAAAEIAGALEDLQRLARLDVIILGRGGGSIEDLWAFNEEIVVRAVAGCRVPVVTGIGHEVDFTLSDLAADVRGATPSQAAELAVPAREAVLRLLGERASRLAQHALARLRLARLRLARLEGSHGLRRPREQVRTRIQRVDDLGLRLVHAGEAAVGMRRRRLEELAARWGARDPRLQLGLSRKRLAELEGRLGRAAVQSLRGLRERLRARAEHLEAVGPRSVLSRGYAICLRRRDRRAVRAWRDVETGEAVDVVLGTGWIGCTVKQREEDWSTEVRR